MTLVKVAKSHHFLLSFVCLLYIVCVCLNCLFVFLILLLPLVVNKDVHYCCVCCLLSHRVISLFGSVFRWDFRWVLNSDWDQRSAKKWNHQWLADDFTFWLHLSHGFQCSPTLNRQPYEGRLPLTSWWRKSSNMTVANAAWYT